MGQVIQLWDSLRNALTGMGTTRDARIASSFFAQPYLNAQEIDAAYRGSGLMRKIIQIPALDMAREWRDWKLEAEQITAVEAEEKRLGIRQKVRQAEVLRGLGGGALILGLPGEPSQPASASVAKEGLAYVHVVSRWHLTFDKLQDDLTQPGFGEPVMWKMATSQGQQQDIHPSRVIPFRADTAIMIATTIPQEEQFWGESTVAQVLDAVKNNDTAQAAFASMLQKASRLRIGIPELTDLVSTTDGQTAIQSRLATMALAESMHNATIFDSGDGDGKGGEEITDAEYSFAGAKDMMNAYSEFASAISDIPATRLLGRAPEGMNASGESQQRDYAKLIRSRQTLDLEPCMDRLDPYLLQSALGTVPDGQWYEWAPLDTPSQKEVAERFKIEAEAVMNVANLAAMPSQPFNRGVQSWLIENGYLPELESALLELSEEERFGISVSLEEEEEVARAASEAAAEMAAQGNGNLPEEQ